MHERPEVRNLDRRWYERIPCRGGAFISLYAEAPTPVLQLYTPMVKSGRAIFNHVKNLPGVMAHFHYDGEAVIFFPPEVLPLVARIGRGQEEEAGPEALRSREGQAGRGRQGLPLWE